MSRQRMPALIYSNIVLDAIDKTKKKSIQVENMSSQCRKSMASTKKMLDLVSEFGKGA